MKERVKMYSNYERDGSKTSQVLINFMHISFIRTGLFVLKVENLINFYFMENRIAVAYSFEIYEKNY